VFIDKEIYDNWIGVCDIEVAAVAADYMHLLSLMLGMLYLGYTDY